MAMSRQMRRKLERDPKAWQRYNRDRDMRQSTILMLHIAMLYLRDKQGYGKKRLGDFVEGCFDILESISIDDINFKDIQDAIYEETGVKIDLTGDYDEII